MAQSLHIGLQGPFTNLAFGICAIYLTLRYLYLTTSIPIELFGSQIDSIHQ